MPEYAGLLASFGLPKPVADVFADCDAAVARGELAESDHSLSRLIGRPTTTLAGAVGAVLR